MSRRPQLLDHVTPTESLQVLHRLLRQHPELADEAETIARFLISEVSEATVAAEVEELVWLPRPRARLDMATAALRVRKALEDTLQPLRDRSKRLLEIGLKDEPGALLRGELLGLHQLATRRDLAVELRNLLLEAALDECRSWVDASRSGRRNPLSPPLDHLLQGPLADWAAPIYAVLATSSR